MLMLKFQRNLEPYNSINFSEKINSSEETCLLTRAENFNLANLEAVRQQVSEDLFKELAKISFEASLQAGDIKQAIEIKQRLELEIDLNQIIKRSRGIIEMEFYRALEFYEIKESAKLIKKEFTNWIDFAPAVRAYFRSNLRCGYIEQALQARSDLGEEMDFSEDIKNSFKETLQRYQNIERAREMYVIFNKEIDLTEAVMKCRGWIRTGLRRQLIQESGLDQALLTFQTFVPIINFDDALRLAVSHNLRLTGPQTMRVKEIQTNFGAYLDLSGEIKQAFTYQLQNGFFEGAKLIQTEFSDKVDFNQTVKDAVLRLLMQGQLQIVQLIKHNFDVNLAEEEKIFNSYLKENRNFNVILEGSRGALVNLELLCGFENVSTDPVKTLYMIRMLALHKGLYQVFQDGLRSRYPYIAGLFADFWPEVEELDKSFNQIGQEKIDNSRFSFNFELESQAVHNVLEKESPITNCRDDIIAFVRKLDDFNAGLKNLIESLTDRRIVGVYDPVHINIGFMDKNLIPILQEEKANKEGLPALLNEIGLIHNPLGRTQFLSYYNPDAMFTIDQPAQAGYPAKIQNRMWCFNFACDNAPFLDVILWNLDKTLDLYQKDLAQGQEKIKEMRVKIFKTISAHQRREELNYADLVYISKKDSLPQVDQRKINHLTIEQPYLPHRKEILTEMMEILGGRR